MKPVLLVLAATFAVLVAAPRPAEAAPVIINTGSDIMFLHSMPKAAVDADPELAGYKVGYKYDLFGVFWLDLWRWNGELVIYQGTTYEPVPAEALELVGGDQVPIGYRLPPGLLLVLTIAAVAILASLTRKRSALLGFAGLLGAGAAGLHFLGIGLSVIIPAGGAIALLFIAFAPAEKKPVSFREPGPEPQP